MEEDNNNHSKEADSLAPEELRLRTLKDRAGYIILNVVLVVLFLLTSCFALFGTSLMQRFSIPLYVPSVALLLEIGLLLTLGYWQHTYSIRFRWAMVVTGIITIGEALIIIYYTGQFNR